MARHKNKEAFYERLNTLAQTKKPSLKESRTLGTLIDFKRAGDGVAYGIIKEQHQYYIKKGGLKTDQNVADFAYIGGLENITEHQYTTFAIADKQRNMMFKTINEANSLKPNPNGSKKKIMLTEDKAGEEIEMAASKVDDLEAATDAAEVAAEVPVEPEAAPEIDAEVPVEPEADVEVPVDAELDAAGGGEDLPDADIENLPVDDAGIEGGEEAPLDDMPVDDAGIEGGEDEGTTELQKSVSGVAKEIQVADLDKGEVKWLLDRFLRAFLPVAGVSEVVNESVNENEEGGGENKMAELDIEDRQELADMILKVIPDEEQASVADSLPDEEGLEGLAEDNLDIDGLDVGMEEEEQQCGECGGFAQYADSLGHDAESMMGADDEEMTNVISGYANAHNDGQNDGDFKAIALFITPEILEKLKGDYGHDDFANKVEPFANEMNECGLEEKEAQINELFGGLGHMAKKAGQGIAKGAQNLGQNIADKAGQVQQAVGQAATNVKQTYHAGEKNAALGKLEKVAADLGKQIAAVNKQAGKAGQEPINVKSILSTISNQVAGSAGTADLSKFRTNEDGSIAIEEPIDGTGIEKPVNEEGSIAIEEPIDNTGIEKPVNEADIPADSVEVQPMVKEDEEEIAVDAEVAVEPDAEGEEAVLDLTKKEDPEMDITSGFETMGGGVVKPDGAAPVTVEIDADANKVNVTMNEGEIKVREYIRKRIKESLGMSKPSLNENKKSTKLLKVDKMIAEQLALYESTMEEGWGEKISNTLGKFSQGLEGRLGKQKELQKMLSTINPEDDNALDRALQYLIKGDQYSAGVGQYIPRTDAAKKYEILQQAANDQQGLGKLKLAQGGLVYEPVSHTDDSGPSGFATGRNRLGENK